MDKGAFIWTEGHRVAAVDMANLLYNVGVISVFQWAVFKAKAEVYEFNT